MPYQKNRIDHLQKIYPDVSAKTGDVDDFLLQVTEILTTEAHNAHVTVANLDIHVRRIDMVPHGVIVTDDWKSEYLMNGCIDAALYRGPNAVKPNWHSGDMDAGAFNQMIAMIKSELKPEKKRTYLIPEPPNLTNGYTVVLPYAGSNGELRNVEVVCFDQIDREPPNIFKDQENPDLVHQTRIILKRDPIEDLLQ